MTDKSDIRARDPFFENKPPEPSKEDQVDIALDVQEGLGRASDHGHEERSGEDK